MKKLILWIGVILLASPLIFGSSVAFAKKGEHGLPKGFEKGEKKGWKNEKVPPGWSKGKKKGWDGKDRPPGLQEEGQPEEQPGEQPQESQNS